MEIPATPGVPVRWLMLALLTVLLSAGSVSAPVVTGISPARHALSVPASSPILVDFSAPLLPSSVDSSTVKIFGHWSGVPHGILTLENGNTRIRFTPARPFSAGELVIVNLSRGIKDQAGEAMAAGHAWTFWVHTAPGTMNITDVGHLTTRRPGEGQVTTYGAYGGDLNRDGFLDLLMTNEASNDVRVRMSDGMGGYGAIQTFSPPNTNTPSPNEGVDLNGDGNMDYIIANYGNNRVGVLLGDGTGTFTSMASYPVASTVTGLAWLDLNGDGHMDIATANLVGNNVGMILNNGDGTFGAASTMNANINGERSCAAADANNDGLMDLFVGGYVSGEMALLLGNGAGGFTYSAKRSAGGNPWMIAVGDVNGDGNVDVVSANAGANNAGVLFGDGQGGLDSVRTYPVGAQAVAIDLGDLDGDGDLDLVVSSYAGNSWTLYENNGSGLFFNPRTRAASSAASCATLHDRDNDGDLDMTGIDEVDDLIFFFRNGPATAVAGQDGNPAGFSLAQNYPNPFNPATTIHYTLSRPGHVLLKITDILGRNVATLVDGYQETGEHSVVFDADRYERSIASGVFFYHIKEGGSYLFNKMLLCR